MKALNEKMHEQGLMAQGSMIKGNEMMDMKA